MDEFEDIKDLAIRESRNLLEESSHIITKGTDPSTVISEVFQKIHTVKSNMALIPGCKSVGLSLQNLETVLAQFREKKFTLQKETANLILSIIDLSLSLLEKIQDPTAQANRTELEKEIMKSTVNLRMKMSAFKQTGT